MRRMDWHYMFASAFARRIAFVVVAACLAWVGIGKAHAQVAECVNPGDRCSTSTVAMQKCEAYRAATSANDPNITACQIAMTGSPGFPAYGYSGLAWAGFANNPESVAFHFKWHVYEEPSQCVAPEWPDPTDPAKCLSFEKCLERNASSEGPRLAATQSACLGGCTYAFKGIRIGTTVNSTGKTMFNGTMGYTGGQCGATPPPATQPMQEPPPPNQVQECVPAGDGQSMCVKPSGEQCHTTSNGKQICWGGGETGAKGDGDVLQSRNAGPTKIDPPLTLPSGDTIVQTTPPVTTTTLTKDANGNTTRSITTTTTNFITTNGTTTPNQAGQPGNGTGTPGAGEGEGDKGSAGGGGTCAAAPSCSGDPIMCAQLQQQWLARCDLEKARNDIGTQSDAASKLMGTEDTVVGDVVGVEGEDLAGTLDVSGFGFGSSCPAPPEIFGVTMNLDGFCDVLTLLGLLVAAIGILHAFYIVQGA